MQKPKLSTVYRVLSASVLILAATLIFAEGTQTWEQSKFEDFEKGTAKGVSILSEGSLELAPQFKPLYTSPSTYLWAITSDSAGNVYAAAGAPARVYRITPNGKSEIIFEPKELQVQALAERDGVIYAATSPDGKIYKIELPREKATEKSGQKSDEKTDVVREASSRWQASVFFDPQTKYIWGLTIDRQGQLYAATGDHGEIFQVTKRGEGSVFFKSDEAHIRVLAFDHKGNLIAGSDGSGLLYRISPAGEAFVLYSAPKKEITALAIDGQDNIYAAGIGEKRTAIPPSPSAVPPNVPPQISGTVPGVGPMNAPAPALSLPPSIFAGATGGSEVYKIAADGSPTRIWSSRDDLVYGLAFAHLAGKEHLLAGTGNKGRILAIREDGEYTDLLKASANQVTGFAPGLNGSLYAATSNLGKVFLLGANLETEGSYESDVYDARLFSRWGRAEARGLGNFDLFARSGNVDNPDRNWSPWQKINRASPNGAVIDAPPARFVQWKAVLHATQSLPRVESVLLNYRSKNAPPVIDEVAVQVGARFPASLKTSSESAAVTVGGSGSTQSGHYEASAPSAFRDKGSIAVRWLAHDDNDDDLIYFLFYRGEGESRWKPLTKEKITDKFYSFDAGLLPDGGYTIKIIASDAPSHPPDEALTAEKESPHFDVDNTPPRIEDLNASLDTDGQIHVTFRATDSFSAIRRAEYSLDAGEWQFVEPVGKLSDAKTENYDFTVPLPSAQKGGGEHVIVVRAYDRFDNLGSGKALIRSK